jgi:hypothetical protein
MMSFSAAAGSGTIAVAYAVGRNFCQKASHVGSVRES